MDGKYMNSNHAVKKVVDAKDLHCPMPIVRTVNEIKQVEIGEIIKVLTTDPGSKRDFESCVEKQEISYWRHLKMKGFSHT